MHGDHVLMLSWNNQGIEMLSIYSSVNGTGLGPRSASCSASNGVDGEVPSSSCSSALSHVINGEATPNSTPVHQPSDSGTESRTGESSGV